VVEEKSVHTEERGTLDGSVAFVADVHVWNHKRCGGPVVAGVNRRASDIIGSIREATTRSAALGASTFVVAGDLFDAVNPPPQVMTEAISAMQAGNQRVVILAGNHDRASNVPGDHCLGPLAHLHRFEVIETPEILDAGDHTIAAIPFLPGHAPDYLPSVVRDLGAPEGSVLCLHLGVYDDNTPFYLKDSDDAVPASLVLALCREHGFPAAVVGNWHERRAWKGEDGTIIQQIGALAPTGWDNPGIDPYGGVAFWNGDRIVMGTAPGPRFLKLTEPKHFDELEGILSGQMVQPSESNDGCTFYVRAHARRGDEDTARERLSAIKNGPGGEAITAFEVVPDATKAKEAAKQAAADTRAAGQDMDTAIRAYVQSMDIPDHVRDAVCRDAMRFMGQ